MSRQPQEHDMKPQAESTKRLMDHLQHEEEALGDTLAVLREVQDALVKNDLDAFSRALERQAVTTQASEEIARKRAEILQEIGQVFDKECESLTLQNVAEALPRKEAEQLMHSRDRMRRLSEQVVRINSQNAAMVQQSVELARQVLAALTTDGPGGSSYTATGTKQDAVGHSIFDVGG